MIAKKDILYLDIVIEKGSDFSIELSTGFIKVQKGNQWRGFTYTIDPSEYGTIGKSEKLKAVELFKSLRDINNKI